MIRKITAGAALAVCMLASAAMADVSDEEWGDIRSFLERNDTALDYVTNMMDRELHDDQVQLDAEYIATHADAIFADPDSPVLGNPEGTVTIVKFTDFRCGYCRAVTPELEDLISSDDRVKLIIKEFPILSSESYDMARFALAIYALGGSDAYHTIQNSLFGLDKPLTREVLVDLAASVNLDALEVFKKAESDEIRAEIQDNVELAHNLKINGTPALIIKDYVVRGSIPLATMQIGISELYEE